MAGPPSVAPEPVLNKARHINYWLRCLKTLLPTDYTSNDSNRMTLGFFIISALDVLGVLETHTKPEERREYIDWIYHCQHPEGGFRGFPATDFGARRTAANAQWDPANLPATFFALATLIVLGDDLTRVRTRQCLAWLPTLQREEGSLGEMLGEGARIEGKRDMRFCYSAAAVRWILRGPRAETVADVPDLDVDAMVRFINASETYEHGFAEGPYREAHAGLTYCAVGTLSLLDRLASASLPASPPATESTTVGLTDPESTIRWLLSRQIIQADDEGDESEDEEADNVPTDVPDLLHHADGVGCFPADFTAAGFNGRCNKDADTCYAFWVSGSMAILNPSYPSHLLSSSLARAFLLNETQHRIGGFGKGPGDVPDILHSYLGLVALSILEDEGDDVVSSTTAPANAPASALTTTNSSTSKNSSIPSNHEGIESKTSPVSSGLRRIDARFCISTKARLAFEEMRIRTWDDRREEKRRSVSEIR